MTYRYDETMWVAMFQLLSEVSYCAVFHRPEDDDKAARTVWWAWPIGDMESWEFLCYLGGHLRPETVKPGEQMPHWVRFAGIHPRRERWWP